MSLDVFLCAFNFVMQYITDELPYHRFASVIPQNGTQYRESDINNAWNEQYQVPYYTS
jgi:hypothetical protein